MVYPPDPVSRTRLGRIGLTLLGLSAAAIVALATFLGPVGQCASNEQGIAILLFTAALAFGPLFILAGYVRVRLAGPTNSLPQNLAHSGNHPEPLTFSSMPYYLHVRNVTSRNFGTKK